MSSNGFENLPYGEIWRVLVEAGKRGAHEEGHKLTRVAGRGMSNVWVAEKNGKKVKAAIRTTRDRWIAFQPVDGGKRWKTLDDVEVVIVVAVDSKDDPQNVEVYMLPAIEVRHRFEEAFTARTEAGQVPTDNFGMWVCLDHDPRGLAASIGSGITEKFRPIAVYSIASLLASHEDIEAKRAEEEDAVNEDTKETNLPPRLTSIGDIMAWARVRIAELASVNPEAVKLDLKIEY
jgi:hypothetical protein